MPSIAETMQQQPMAGGEGAPVQDEEQAELERALALHQIDQLGQALAQTRADAIAARQASGIEDEWLEDEEFYQGIDDANRAEAKSVWRKKVPGQAEAKKEGSGTRSTVFPNVTRPYCDSAAARIADMLLPTDDRSWSIRPTPLPDAEEIAQDVAKGNPPEKLVKEIEGAYPDPAQAKNQLAIATQAALEVVKEAKAKAEKAQTRIEDWHVECQWHAQVRLVIEDASRVGTGVLKGPHPTMKARIGWKDNRIQQMGEIKPGSKWIDYWNLYPDAACGENIHNGSYVWERDYVTKKQLRELRNQKGYIPEQIDRCIAEGPRTAKAEWKPTVDSNVDTDNQNKDRFEIWYFHGTAEKEHLLAAGVDIGDATDPHMPAMIVMVNDRVIKMALNPLDTGEFPYDVMVWQRRAGHWAGIGVARQIRTPQRIVTAATRNLMDNAGLAAGPIIVFRQGVVYPADGGPARLAPRMVYYIKEDATEMVDATKAIGSVKVDMLVKELMEIIQLGLKLAEDVTGLPMLLQGQQGDAPDTLGGQQLVNNNASAVLRRLARLFDDRVTEPHVRRYYVWLLQYGPDEEKGDYCIDARGSSALVERDLQNQAIGQLGQLILDPRFGKDPKKWMDEYLKSQRLDPDRFNFDDEEWAKIVENMAKGPQDPRLQIAQMRLQSEEQGRKFQAALTAAEQNWQSHENERDRQFQLILEDLERDVTKGVSTDQIKAKLTDTVLKLKTQRDLSVRDDATQRTLADKSNSTKVATAAAKQVAKPGTEPRGRAPRGQGFQH